MPDPAAQEDLLLDAAGITATVDRLAHEVAARSETSPVLVGLYTRGVTLANRLSRALSGLGLSCPVGALDVSLYRDDLADLSKTPRLESTELPFSMDGARVVLCDEVLYTGRTVRAALDGLMDFGRPARVELAVLVDRGNRELPIRPDFVGLTVETGPGDYVQVCFREDDDGREGVYLIR